MKKLTSSFYTCFGLGTVISFILFGIMIGWTTTSLSIFTQMLYSMTVWSLLGGFVFSFLFYQPHRPYTPMPANSRIENKRLYYQSIIGIGLLSILVMPFPHQYPLAEHLLLQLHVIPVWKSDPGSTVSITSILMILFFIACLSALVQSLRQGRVIVVLLAFMFIGSAPPFMIDAIQKHAASGIYAIQFDDKKPLSICQWDFMTDEGNGSCVIQGRNLSSTPVVAKIVLLSSDWQSQNEAYTVPNITLQRVVFEPQDFSRTIQIHLTPSDQQRSSSHMTAMKASYDGLVLLSEDGQHRNIYHLSHRPLFPVQHLKMNVSP